MPRDSDPARRTYLRDPPRSLSAGLDAEGPERVPRSHISLTPRNKKLVTVITGLTAGGVPPPSALEIGPGHSGLASRRRFAFPISLGRIRLSPRGYCRYNTLRSGCNNRFERARPSLFPRTAEYSALLLRRSYVSQSPSQSCHKIRRSPHEKSEISPRKFRFFFRRILSISN